MTKKTADNLLACLDGQDVPSSDLIREVKMFGAKETHTTFVNHMQGRGWRDGATGTTNAELLVSPHIRPWKHLVKAQRDIYDACVEGSVQEHKVNPETAYDPTNKDTGMNDGVENV